MKNNCWKPKNKNSKKKIKSFSPWAKPVYKEKKRIGDEENEKLILEKEKLAAEKAKVDEKSKKTLEPKYRHSRREKERINLLKLEIEDKHKHGPAPLAGCKVILCVGREVEIGSAQ